MGGMHVKVSHQHFVFADRGKTVDRSPLIYVLFFPPYNVAGNSNINATIVSTRKRGLLIVRHPFGISVQDP